MPTGRRHEINVWLAIGSTLSELGRSGVMKLLRAVNLHPPVQEYVLDFVEKRRNTQWQQLGVRGFRNVFIVWCKIIEIDCRQCNLHQITYVTLATWLCSWQDHVKQKNIFFNLYLCLLGFWEPISIGNLWKSYCIACYGRKILEFYF